jgi:hypothetical protein
MDPSPENHANRHNPINEAISQRPFKVQKTNSLQTSQPSSSLNIPAFMGPIPTIQHHENLNYTPYSPNNLQNEGIFYQNPNQGQDSTYNQQDQQSFQQESPRRYKTTSPNNNTPNKPNKDPFCMYKEEHVADGIFTCNNTFIGKILSNKTILKPVLLSTLQGIWGNRKRLVITEIEGGFFHIYMDLEKDI